MVERGQSEQPAVVAQNRRPASSNDSGPIEKDRSSNSSFTNERGETLERKTTANRGFAVMDAEKQKRIASEGGRAAHKQGVAHEWSKDEARAAGRKGGQIVSQDREHMSAIGRKGGQNSGQRRGQQSGGGEPQ